MLEEPGFHRELRNYLIGFVLALALTVIPFSLVAWSRLPKPAVLAAIGACGTVQILVHFRYFLHIDPGRQAREDLQLIIFSALLLAIMVGGTIWIMGNLALRMMQ